jgi:hypothetical protein
MISMTLDADSIPAMVWALTLGRPGSHMTQPAADAGLPPSLTPRWRPHEVRR